MDLVDPRKANEASLIADEQRRRAARVQRDADLDRLRRQRLITLTVSANAMMQVLACFGWLGVSAWNLLILPVPTTALCWWAFRHETNHIALGLAFGFLSVFTTGYNPLGWIAATGLGMLVSFSIRLHPDSIKGA